MFTNERSQAYLSFSFSFADGNFLVSIIWHIRGLHRPQDAADVRHVSTTYPLIIMRNGYGCIDHMIPHCVP